MVAPTPELTADRPEVPVVEILGDEAPAAQRSFRVFLLSPANCSGKKAGLLQSAQADHDLARRLRSDGAPLGEVFSFMSSLYFRGKLAYARTFARAPHGAAGIQVITPCDGLATPDSRIGVDALRRWAGVPVDPGEPRYREPLLRDLERLRSAWDDAEVILLGSIASPKYAQLLTSIVGHRVLFPLDFVGRGDMSRGGLMLRCADEGRELQYVPLVGATRHGPRPARLPPLRRRA